MTAHELARKLLEMEDIPVVYSYFNGGPDMYEIKEVVDIKKIDVFPNLKPIIDMVGERTKITWSYDKEYNRDEDIAAIQEPVKRVISRKRIRKGEAN